MKVRMCEHVETANKRKNTKKKIKNKLHYLVSWKGFDESSNSWEPASVLKEDIPDEVKKYEKNNR